MKESKYINCSVSPSISSILGSITSYATEFFKSKFPEGYFKDVYIMDSLVSSNMSDKNDEVVKPSTPYLVVNPIYLPEDGFMGALPYWHGTNYFLFKNKKHYRGIVYDDKNDIYIYSIPERLRISFECKVKVPTVLSGYDVQHYIKNNFEAGGYNYLNKINYRTEIPKLYIWYICQILNLDMNKKDDRIKLTSYLNKHSRNLVEEIVNPSTGNISYSYRYNTNILVNYEDSTPDMDKNSKDLIVDNTVISYTFYFEFWSPSNFIMELKNNKELEKMPEELNNYDNVYKFDICLDDVNFIKDKIADKFLVINKTFVPEVNQEIDILEFEPIIEKEFLKTIECMKKYNFTLDKILNVKILINNKLLDKEFYDVDWKKFVLKTKKPMKNTTYTFLVYAQTDIFNKVYDLISNDKEKDVIKLLV